MSKLAFFLKFYRTQKIRFLILIFIFTFAGAILSCSLLVQSNNDDYANVQMKVLNDKNVIDEGFDGVFIIMEKVMTIFSLGSVLIVVWGCTSILFFQNISMQKSFAMLRIFGMQKKDVFIRACVEGISFGLSGSFLGCVGGYGLFVHLSRKLCNIEEYISIFSMETAGILLIVMGILTLIAFFGSFVSGLFIYETPVVTMFYGRDTNREKKTCFYYGILEFVLLYAAMTVLFLKNWKYMNIMLVICGVILGMLFAVFYLVFSGRRKKRNERNKVLDKVSGISWRFLCTRNKRDALLAATVSVGAIIICIALNFILDFGGVLRASYSDNVGFSTAVEVSGIQSGEWIGELLDENRYFYTTVYCKNMKYADIGVSTASGESDAFDAMLIGKQTDGNNRFRIPEGTFIAENYFAYLCGLERGEKTNVLGRELICSEFVSEKQVFTPVTYNFKVNRSDWELPLDDTWETVFLLDISREEEKDIELLLEGEVCSIETASSFVDMIVELLSDYLSVISAVGIMLILVTGTFFYSMVRSDLLARKREMYLYQIYGASRRKAFWVVFLEYLMIAWIASFSVVLVAMIAGEGIFSFLLNKHYPMSIPVILITSIMVTFFVLACCYIAQWINFIGEKMEIIRDE